MGKSTRESSYAHRRPIEFYGHDYRKNHIDTCPTCRQQTLHIGKDWQKCINPDCNHCSGVNAEGNVFIDGQIVSNGGRSIEQLRNEYVDGYSLWLMSQYP